MTFDEWYDYKRMMHLFRPEDIARVAYEAGTRSRDELIRKLTFASIQFDLDAHQMTVESAALLVLDRLRDALKETKP